MKPGANLPSGWAALPLRAVCDLGKTRILPAEAADLPYIGLEHIARDTHELSGVGRAQDTSSLKSMFAAGDVLYGRLRPNLNKVILAPWDGMASTDILVMRPNSLIEPGYLLQLLSSTDFIDYAVARAKGINLPRLSTGAVLDYVAAIPPRATQRAILEALETRLGALTANRRRLEGIVTLAAKAVPIILASAAKGELTRTWRANPGEEERPREAPAEAGTASGTPLPEGWILQTIGEAGHAHTGRARTPQNHQGNHMRPYLRVANVLEGRFDLTDVMTMNFSPGEFERFRLRRGDILLNEGQSLELVGRPALFSDEMEEVAFTNSLIRFRCGPTVIPEFAEIVFRHYLHAGVFRAVAKISTNLAHLSASRFSALPFATPPLEEQRRIVVIAQQSLDQLERARKMLATIALKISALIGSLRAQALAGELVVGDPGAEPVSETLNRLRRSPLAVNRAPQDRPRRKLAMKTIQSLVETLDAAKLGLTGQQLFLRAGYPEDASTDTVERFYLHLREDLAAGRIERREVAGAEIFVSRSPLEEGRNED